MCISISLLKKSTPIIVGEVEIKSAILSRVLFKKKIVNMRQLIIIRAFSAQYMSRAGVAPNDLPVRKSQTLILVELLRSIAILEQYNHIMIVCSMLY